MGRSLREGAGVLQTPSFSSSLAGNVVSRAFHLSWLRIGLQFKLRLPHPHQLPPGSQHSIRADGSLHLDRALQEDAGRYSCVVTNTAGSQHRDVELVVQGESQGGWGGGCVMGWGRFMGRTQSSILSLKKNCANHTFSL